MVGQGDLEVREVLAARRPTVRQMMAMAAPETLHKAGHQAVLEAQGDLDLRPNR